MHKTSVYTLVNGNIKELTHRKQKISQKVILFSSTLTHSQCDVGSITFCDFCCFRCASSWFLRSGEVREFKSTMVQKLTKMQKKTELLHEHCVQQFKIFSARFARRLFILLLFHLFCRPCF